MWEEPLDRSSSEADGVKGTYTDSTFISAMEF